MPISADDSALINRSILYGVAYADVDFITVMIQAIASSPSFLMVPYV